MQLKNLLLLFLCLSFLNATYSQKYNVVDSIVDAYPKSIISTDQLVGLINSDFSKQDEKARAVFKWVATNISYDVDLAKTMEFKSMNAFSYKTEKEKEIKERKFKLDLVTGAMVSRQAVCHSYAALVEYLCLKLGIEAKIIIGNLKSNPSQILRDRLFGAGKIGNDMSFAWVNKDNILTVYDNFFESYKKNKGDFTREDYDEIKLMYEALDSRKNTVEKEGLTSEDNRKIAAIKFKLAPMFKVNRIGAKSRENQEAKE